MDNLHSKVIPMTWLHWGWQSWFDINFEEVELEVGKTFQTVQGFAYRSTFNQSPVFTEKNIGKLQVFLLSPRYFEVNGNEFFDTDIERYQVVIGKLKEVSTFSKKFPLLAGSNQDRLSHDIQYTPETPIFGIEVLHIFALQDYLDNPKTEIFDPIQAFLTFDKHNFWFEQMRDRTVTYRIEANKTSQNVIHINTSTGEHNQTDFLIAKEIINHQAEFFIRFYQDYFVDDTTYLLANYRLSKEEIQRFTLNDRICQKFFEN